MPLVSKRTRYAFHGLAFLSVYAQDKPLPLDAVMGYLRRYSGELTLSPGYIVKIFQQISRAGLTESVSGPRGGYRLARPANTIRLIDIVEALEGPSLTGCCLLSVGTCADQNACGVRDKIQQAELAFHQVFAGETIASLADGMNFSQVPDPRPGGRPESPPAGGPDAGRKGRRLPASRGRDGREKQD
jgi:Rrf2 family protein